MLNTRWLAMMVFGPDWASDISGGGGGSSFPEPYTITNYGIFPLGNARQRLL